LPLSISSLLLFSFLFLKSISISILGSLYLHTYIQYSCTSIGGSSWSTRVHTRARALEARTHQVELKDVGHNFINKHKSKKKQLMLLIKCICSNTLSWVLLVQLRNYESDFLVCTLTMHGFTWENF
jgi:hypothetical protein